MKLSIVLLFVFINFSSVIGEYRQFNVQLDGCPSIVSTEIGKCSKTLCNSKNSIIIKHVNGNLYQIYRFNDETCINSLNYQYLNCSTAPLISNPFSIIKLPHTEPTSSVSTTTTTSITNTASSTTSTSSFNEQHINIGDNSEVFIYCHDEMSSSSNEDDNNLVVFQQDNHQSSHSNKLLPYNTIFNIITLFSFLFTLI